MTDVLDSIREGRLLRLTLNRPDKRNALDAKLCRALVRALDDAGGDPEVGAIVLTGQGKAFCAGMDLAEAGPEASFGLTEIRLGLWPFLVYRAVAAAMGERRTLELSLTGRIFGAREAREFGLAHEVAEDAAGRAVEIAREVAGFSPTAVRCGMSFVKQVRGLGWEEAGAVAREMRNQVFTGKDFQEGIRAFREKRNPRWPSIEG